jgi:hypothetical protein
MNGTKGNPIHMKIVGSDISVGKLTVVALFTVAPVAAAIIMQNPALRQSLEMKFWNGLRAASRNTAKLSAKLESIAATRYDIARL